MMNTTETPNRAAKDTLARLLATENITVQHQPVPTACFDVASRVLILPVWKDMDGDLYDMLVMHEVGHALFTPAGEGPLMDACNSIDPSNPGRVKSYLNICEDPRIEMLMKKKFPGGKRQFAIAYRTLWERGFFGVTESDIATKGFGDRANLHFKVGFLMADGTIPFTDEEQVIIDAIEAATTWDEMVECARAMYDLAPKEAPETNDQPEQGDGEGDTGMPGMPGEPGESGQGDDGSDEPSESGDGESGEGDDGEDIGESMDDDSDDGESAESTAGDGNDDSSDDAPAADQQGEDPTTGDDAGETIQEGGTEAGTQAPAAEEIETASSFDKALEAAADLNGRERFYGTMPKTINMDNVVIDFTTVHKAFIEGSNFDATRMASIAKSFMNETRPTVNTMVKQFEALMAADVDRRTAIGKSGVLDPNRLHSYSITEDIFLRRETVSEGKNHGIVMFMDWSGSMNDVIGDVVKQVVNLALFCQKVNIPFEVYGFSSNCYYGDFKSHWDRTEEENEAIAARTTADYENGDIHIGAGYSREFQLHNWLSSRMNTRQFNTAVANLMCFAVNRWNSNDPNADAVQSIARCFDLGSTPLNEALMVAQYIIPAFRKANDLQIVNTVVLTDGDSSGNPSSIEGSDHCTYSGEVFITSRKTKKSYNMTRNNGTVNLVNMLRDETGSRVIGMFIASGSKRSCASQVENQIHRAQEEIVDWNKTQSLSEKAVAEFNKTNTCVIDHHAYDEYYVLKGDTEIVDGNDLDGLDHNASVTKIRNTFIKNGKSKQSSRTILSRMAGTIASQLS